ncbi:hypothetical protein [Acetobacter conturbans]|uniref:Uncharacterized protein n=1 Tax=Acetobacter conturbans TaxID=1737472 RepID=A0ABX0K314_9PROT|nr:hypothetical protein [Acetobacter conturbans]NHN89592.1 hypothetical protein [Acetobacter conturbans]
MSAIDCVADRGRIAVFNTAVKAAVTGADDGLNKLVVLYTKWGAQFDND